MAQKKKKGPAPQQKKPARPRKSTNQIVFYVFGVLIIIAMILPLLIPTN